jgi:hypothetical protein
LEIGFQAFPESLETDSSDKIKKIQEHVEICRKEIGIEEELALKLSAGDFTVRDEKAQVRTLSCFKGI